MNKIKGQADSQRPRRAKNAGAKPGREDFSPKITPEMVEAGVGAFYGLDQRPPYSTGDIRDFVAAIVGAALAVSRSDRPVREAHK